MTASKKVIKFHGQEVQNVILRYLSKRIRNVDGSDAVSFDAREDSQGCETINVQVVSEFVTITFYRDEKANSIIRRELVPTHQVERIDVEDLARRS